MERYKGTRTSIGRVDMRIVYKDEVVTKIGPQSHPWLSCAGSAAAGWPEMSTLAKVIHMSRPWMARIPRRQPYFRLHYRGTPPKGFEPAALLTKQPQTKVEHLLLQHWRKSLNSQVKQVRSLQILQARSLYFHRMCRPGLDHSLADGRVWSPGEIYMASFHNRMPKGNFKIPLVLGRRVFGTGFQHS